MRELLRYGSCELVCIICSVCCERAEFRIQLGDFVEYGSRLPSIYRESTAEYRESTAEYRESTADCRVLSVLKIYTSSNGS
eukprot:scaffold9470_cov131-Skeletonema_menzelii.AAC.2